MNAIERAAHGSEKIFGVTHRGTDGETRAYLESGVLWISDGVGGWLRCNPGVESYFSPHTDFRDGGTATPGFTENANEIRAKINLEKVLTNQR